jgi:hypothetical protein
VTRRELFALLAAVAPLAATRAAPPAPAIAVWRTPTCGCCGAWVRHLEAAGFRTEVTVQDDLLPIKRRYGITPALESCHTAVVAGYVIEGHVPAADIARLLRERPAGVQGLAVPGMPAGSPGMEGPVAEPYATLALRGDGTTAVFARHEPAPVPR